MLKSDYLNIENNEKIQVKEFFKQRKSPYFSWSEDKRKIFMEICSDAMIKVGYEIPEMQ